MGQFTLDSYRTDSNMAKLLILSTCLALATAAPGGALLGALAPAGYAGLAGGAVVGTAVAPGPVAVHEQVHAGPAIAQHRTISGVVGHRQIQVGTQTVQVGHQYAQTGEVAHARPAYTEIAAPATNSASVRAIPAPPLPAPAAPAPIPPPAANYGPAPADAVPTPESLHVSTVSNQNSKLTKYHMTYQYQYQFQSKEPLSTPYMSQNHTKLPYHVLSQSHNPTRSTQSNKLLKLQSSTRRLSPFNNPLYTPLSNNMSKLMLPQLLL